MLATATTNTTFTTYDRSGKTGAFLRSEPARPVANIFDQGSTTTEKYKDKVSLSPDGLDKSRQEATIGDGRGQDGEATESHGDKRAAAGQQPGTQQLSEAEEKIIRQLKERDREVKAHEMAHLASSGQYARGGPSYAYQQGPDGRRYTVGGEVPIDIGKERSPEETIQKMQAVQRAAMAPADPSATDRGIAANAAALENQARQELQHERTNPQEERTDAPSEEAPQTAGEATVSSSRRRLPEDVFA